MAAITTEQPPAPGQVTLHYRFTVDQYDRMVDAGILAEGEKVELVDGTLVSQMTRSPEHGYSANAIVTAV